MKDLKQLLIVAFLTMVMTLAFACGGSDDDDDNGEVMGDTSDLTEGALAEAEVEILEDGTLYSLEIELGGDDDDDDDNDDNDDEDDDEFEEEFTAPVEAIAEDFSSVTFFGGLVVMLDLEDDDDDEDDEDEDELAIDELTVGMWVEVEGLYDAADGIFHADEIEAADEEEMEISSIIQNLTDSSFTMLGLTITFDENTEVELDGDDDDDDDDDDEDDD